MEVQVAPVAPEMSPLSGWSHRDPSCFLCGHGEEEKRKGCNGDSNRRGVWNGFNNRRIA